MSYRKITVDDKTYEYTIGRSHVKIKTIGVFLKETIGEKVAKFCECCGESLDILYSEDELTDADYTINVRPSHIRAVIKKAG